MQVFLTKSSGGSRGVAVHAVHDRVVIAAPIGVGGRGGGRGGGFFCIVWRQVTMYHVHITDDRHNRLEYTSPVTDFNLILCLSNKSTLYDLRQLISSITPHLNRVGVHMSIHLCRSSVYVADGSYRIEWADR